MSVVDHGVAYEYSQNVGSHEAVDLSFLRFVMETLSTIEVAFMITG